MLMKIARPMPGIEGLLTAPVPVHTGAGAAMVSFAEKLGESLTAPVKEDATQQAVKPDNLLKAGATDKKANGQTAKFVTKSASLGVSTKAVAGAIAPEHLATTIEASDGSGPATRTTAVTAVQDDGMKQVPPATEPIPKLGQQVDAANGTNEGTAGKSEETSMAVERAAIKPRGVKGADPSEEINGAAKLSRATAAKGKATEASLRHKEKQASEDTVSDGHASQRSPQIETPTNVQPSGVAGLQVTTVAAPYTVAGEASQRSSVEVKKAAASGSKPAALVTLRPRQSNQAATKAMPAPQAMTGAISQKPVDAASHEGKAAVDATTKFDVADHRSSAQDKDHAATQVAFQPGTTVVAAQGHAFATAPAEKTSSAAPAHTVHTPEIETAASRMTYAPADHGTITATPTALEVGVPEGTHGWLKVRAELGGDGTVHASMSSNSAAGTESLRRELPQLTSYLHQEQLRVSSVVVHAPHAASEFSNQGSGDSRGQTMNGGSPDTRQGDGGSGGPGANHSQARMSQAISAPDGDGDLLLPGGLGSAGGWLSVRA